MNLSAKQKYLPAGKAASVCAWLLISSIMVVISCGPGEKPPSLIPGPADLEIVIDAGGLASHYYSLKDKKIISSSRITDWDLSFDCDKKFCIYLNTGKHMRLARYAGDFSDGVEIHKITNWKTDLFNKGRILSAMGNWGDFSFSNPQSFGYTYVLDLGYLDRPGEFGYRKIRLLGCRDNIYTLLYAQPWDPVGDTLRIRKNPEYNHVFVSFTSAVHSRLIEPPSAQWDLQFTQCGVATPVYKDSIVTDTAFRWTDYILMNPAGRQIACDTLKPFSGITFWDAEKYTYSTYQDFIGDRWRAFDPMLGIYYLTRRTNYVLRNTKYLQYKFSITGISKTAPGLTRIRMSIQNI